ncbi:basic amino acid/polyamine antiporter [Agromyces sp. LHK192]|uniref:basic amino acid/polyamine antiporter n=1 Tax=Agromyces sp. LHK192 TaxID=2498704 RepID=UPI000FD87B6E|nr:basic amino acid/polyamine antiporter [Agromyces sp. LHK192]
MSRPGGVQGARGAVKLGVPTLTAMVVGSMVGAGVFSLPATFAQETGVLGALIAWVIAGLGMLMLALAFQALAVRRPQLDAGVYAYAKAGFGELIGFFSAFGYWASACVGNVTYWVLIMSTLGAVIPALGAGDTLLSFALSSVGLWVFFLLVRRGVREAAAVNRIVTVAKLVPILVAIVLALSVLDPAVFAANLLGGTDTGGLFEQVQGTMLITVFVFLGVEGASVYSRHARRRADVGRATVLGFLAVFSVFASVTIVSFGVMPADDLAALRQPSLAGVLEAAVGPWGAVLVSAGLIVSVLGAYLAWTLMAAEVVFVAAKDGDMPRFLARANDRDVPVGALLSSTVLAQAVLVVAMFAVDAFDFALNLTSALALVPFLFAAGYLLRIGISPDAASDDRRTRRRDLVIGALATVYVLFLLVGAGWSYLLVSLIVQVPAVALFLVARHQRGRRLLTPAEWVILGMAAAGAVVGVVGIAAGWIVL